MIKISNNNFYSMLIIDPLTISFIIQAAIKEYELSKWLSNNLLILKYHYIILHFHRLMIYLLISLLLLYFFICSNEWKWKLYTAQGLS